MKKHIYTIALSLLTAVTMVGCQEVYSPVDNIPVVETSAAENVGATRTTLCGVITKEAYDDFNFSRYEEQAPHYFFLLSQYEDLTDSTRIEARRDSDTCYAEVSGLAPATTYYYALCVANDYSMVMREVQSLTTEKNTIIEVTTFGMVMEAVKEDRAPLDGSFKAETDCEAFFLLSETPTFENSRKIPANVNNGNCSVWAEGLTQGTTYYYKLSVFDQYNNTMEGEVQSFTTKEEVFVEITPDQITPGQLVDLGLSVMWAGWNVGATSPEGLGGYYAWGEIKEKDDYSEKSYLYYNMDKDSYVNIGNITGSDYDVAHVKWGGGWRMPTVAETEELAEHCTFRWASLEGTKGCHIIGPNGNSIFLPAAGYRNGTEENKRGSAGYYWSGTLDESYSGGAYCLNFYSDGGVQSWSGGRSLGYTVRPVYDINQIDESAVAEAIDLGLSVEWASWNVGATAPEEFGGYYAWGETEMKSGDDYENLDIGSDISDTEYDVAHVKWGDGWRMPTLEEFRELATGCSWEWTSVNNVYGLKGTGPNGNFIFLPGFRESGGCYWSSTLFESFSSYAHHFCFNSGVDGGYFDVFSRASGYAIRPVRNKEPKPEPVVAEAIDLGLSVKWASHNVGATAPEEYGDYFAWGETEVKDDYSESTYLYYQNTESVDIGADISGTEYDVAHVKWSDGWRMPTLEEFRELCTGCSWEWTSVNGVNGCKVTGPNENYIFLPAAGKRTSTEVVFRGSHVFCWSGTLFKYASHYAYHLSFGSGDLSFGSGDLDLDGYYRSDGYTVRPVTN